MTLDGGSTSDVMKQALSNTIKTGSLGVVVGLGLGALLSVARIAAVYFAWQPSGSIGPLTLSSFALVAAMVGPFLVLPFALIALLFERTRKLRAASLTVCPLRPFAWVDEVELILVR